MHEAIVKEIKMKMGEEIVLVDKEFGIVQEVVASVENELRFLKIRCDYGSGGGGGGSYFSYHVYAEVM